MSVVAGWYDDPENPGRSRWWDGERWASPSSAAPTPPPEPFLSAPGGGFGPANGLGPHQSGGFGGLPPGVPTPPMLYGGGSFHGAPSAKPESYLVWAVLSTLLCCLPLGVASIVFAARVDGQWASGDYAGASESSEKAKKFALASAGLTLVVGVLYGIAIVFAAGA